MPTIQPPAMSTVAPVSAAPVPPATVAGMMLRGPRPTTMPNQQQQQPGQVTAPGQIPMMPPDQAATTVGTHPLSHFSAASTGTGTQSSLSQLAAMSQAPRPTESMAPAGMTPAGRYGPAAPRNETLYARTRYTRANTLRVCTGSLHKVCQDNREWCKHHGLRQAS